MGLPARRLEDDDAPAIGPVEIAPPRMSDRELLAAIRNRVAQSNMDTVARGVGVHRGTIARLLDGQFTLSDSNRARLTAYLDTENLRARDAATGLGARTLVKTSVAEAIGRVALLAQVQHSIALVQGPAGTGKTYGALHYAAGNPSAIYINTSPRVNAPGRMVEELWHLAGFRYRRLHVPASTAKTKDGQGKRANYKRRPHRAPTIKSQYDQIVRAWRVDEAEVSNRIIIIDQAHELGDKTVACLQAIHDDTRIAMLFLTTNRWARFDAGGGDCQQYEQIVSRIGVRRSIAHASRSDVVSIAKGWLPTGAKLAADAEKYLTDLSLMRGGLRIVKWHVDLAYRLDSYSPKPGEALTARHLAMAHDLLAGRIGGDE